MSIMDSIEEKYEDEIAKLKIALAEKEEKIAVLTKGLRNVLYQGHNEDCLFCGFKDKIATEALRGEAGKCSRDTLRVI